MISLVCFHHISASSLNWSCQRVGLSAWLFIPALVFPAWVWGCMLNQIGNWKGRKLNKEKKIKALPWVISSILLAQCEDGVRTSMGGCEWRGMKGLPLQVAGLEQGFTVWIWQYVWAVHACLLLWAYTNTLIMQPARSQRSSIKNVLWLYMTAVKMAAPFY